MKRKGTPIRDSWWRWKLLKLRMRIVNDAGWHFSWVMDDERISEKMATISHTEHNLPTFNNPDHIRRCVEHNVDIWNRPRKMVDRHARRQLAGVKKGVQDNLAADRARRLPPRIRSRWSAACGRPV
nr:Paraquat-inducible protein B [Candidatus Pantoea persica]